MVAIKKTAPEAISSIRTVADRSYPLILPLFRYSHGNNPEQQVRQFVEFCAMMGLGLK